VLLVWYHRSRYLAAGLHILEWVAKFVIGGVMGLDRSRPAEMQINRAGCEQSYGLSDRIFRRC
jgi:hypothetical protein